MILLPNLLKFYHQNKNGSSIENYTFEDYLKQKEERAAAQTDETLSVQIGSIYDVIQDFSEKEVTQSKTEPQETKEQETKETQQKAEEGNFFAPEDAKALKEAREKAEALAKEIVEKAEAEAQAILEEAEKKADVLKQHAQDQGFKEGYDEGYAKSVADVKEVVETQSRQYLEEIRDVVEQVTEEKEKILQKYKQDLRNIAIAIGEKVVHVSLKSSGGVIEKMILSATEKLKTREWAKIYISKSDADIMLRGDRDLVQSLSRLSEHIKVVVMENEKPGTCIIELPNEIIDASASTQMENIKEILNSTGI